MVKVALKRLLYKSISLTINGAYFSLKILSIESNHALRLIISKVTLM